MKYELNKNNNSKKLIIVISILFSTVILIVGGTLAFFTRSDSKGIDDIATTDKITLDYSDNTTYMRSNIIPVVEHDVTKFASKNLLNSTETRKYNDDDICYYQNNMYACSLYEFTIKNTASVNQNISISMIPTLNEYNNLKFIIYESKVNEINNDLIPKEEYTEIKQDEIIFENLNQILKVGDSKTYTVVFYVKNLNELQDDEGKRFSASILVNSLTTGYNVVTQLGEGCYDFEQLDDGTIKLTNFNGINHETGEILDTCGVTQDGEYYSVTIPSTYAGLKVSTLGNSLFYPIDLNKFTESDLQYIFISKHYNIKEINIKEGITKIEDGVDLGYIPQLETEIRIGFFTYVGQSLLGARSLSDGNIKINFPNSLEYIGDYAFNASLISEYKLPNKLEYIGNRAFANDDYLTEIYIPASVKEISLGAFWSANSNLKNVTFEDSLSNPSQLRIIGYSAFAYALLEKIIIPSSVEEIGEDAFYDNRQLSKLTINDSLSNPSKLTSIGQSAFGGTNLTYNGTSEEEYLQLPASINFIGVNAFYGVYGPVNLNFIRFKGTREQLDLLGTDWYSSNITTVKAFGE